MTKCLIVNADDFGRSPAVSRGILYTHRKGIVTSTTVMVNQPGIERQLPQALDCPDLGIGLHLVFSAWKPILPAQQVSGLVNREGFFLEQHTLWAQAEQVPVGQLRSELRAQVDRFIGLAGRAPDHLDCHHFVHLYPPFFQVYADLAAEFNLPLRVPFPPETEFPRAIDTLPFLEGFPNDLVRGMIATNSALIGARGLRHPDQFLGTFFGRESHSVEFLWSLLAALPHGVSELMCHPGYVDSHLESSSYRSERVAELALLTHPEIREAVRTLGIELVTFSQLG